MNTDQDLLEMAAKAAGFNLTSQMIESGWNPLTDDGDALRLAVKLGLTIQHNARGVFCYDSPDFCDKSNTNMIEVWENSADQTTNTRRAIVRAAAEIGKVMK